MFYQMLEDFDILEIYDTRLKMMNLGAFKIILASRIRWPGLFKVSNFEILFLKNALMENYQKEIMIFFHMNNDL